jgi:hypothetical protein
MLIKENEEEEDEEKEEIDFSEWMDDVDDFVIIDKRRDSFLEKLN